MKNLSQELRKVVNKKSTFRDELRRICSEREMTLVDLAKEIGVIYNYFSSFGTTKGISFNRLEQVINFFSLDYNEANNLRRLAKYSIAKFETITIDDKFVKDVVALSEIEGESFSIKLFCKTVLRFGGVKAKVK